MTPEEDETVVKAFEAFYSAVSRLRDAAAALENLHRKHLVETLGPAKRVPSACDSVACKLGRHDEPD